MREKKPKRPVEHMTRADDVSTIHATTPSKRVTISSQERNIELPQDAHYQHIEELDIRNCDNAVSVDLSTSDIGPALRIIRAINNGPIEQLTFPSTCPNLEELIIMGNWPGLEVLPEVDPHLLQKLREQHYPYRNWGTGELATHPTLEERRMYWKELEIPRPREPVKPPVFDLSGLDGCPRLRVLKITKNHFGKSGVILPSRCPALEAVLLYETKVKEWRLEGSPKIRLVKLEIPDYDYGDSLSIRPKHGSIDLSPLLALFKSPRKPPLISIKYRTEYEPEEVIIGYDKFPKRVKERMIIMCTPQDQIHYSIPPFSYSSKIWNEYLFLLGVYGE